jgi:hypothetical protein
MARDLAGRLRRISRQVGCRCAPSKYYRRSPRALLVDHSDLASRNVPTRRENVADALVCAVLHDPIGDSPAILQQNIGRAMAIIVACADNGPAGRAGRKDVAALIGPVLHDQSTRVQPFWRSTSDVPSPLNSPAPTTFQPGGNRAQNISGLIVAVLHNPVGDGRSTPSNHITTLPGITRASAILPR